MAQEEQKSKRSSRIDPIRLIQVICGLFIVAVLLFSAPPVSEINWRVAAKNDVMSLVTAIKAFNTEYGHLPLSERRMFLDEASQAALLRVLQGNDQTENPRRVVFFEGRPAMERRDGWFKPKNHFAGLNPDSGAMLDPWGRPYRILLDYDYDNKIQSPYADDTEIRTPVVVWSLGKDGVQGSPGKENILKDSDDVVSWR